MEHSRTIQDRLDDVLAALPAEVATGHQSHHRLVVSTGGVFVLDPGVPGVNTTPITAEGLATITRDRLAERLRWVPFVDWFVITETEATHSQLPVDLIASTVLDGHSVDAATVRRISALLDFGELSPPWDSGLPDRLVPDDFIRTRPTSDITTF